MDSLKCKYLDIQQCFTAVVLFLLVRDDKDEEENDKENEVNKSYKTISRFFSFAIHCTVLFV